MTNARYLLLAFFSLCSLSTQAQAIIRDKDGYTNVRDSGDINASVNFRMLENQVFLLNDWGSGPKPKWLPVSLTTGIDSTNCYAMNSISGFIHESRVLELEDMQKQYSPQIEGTKATISSENFEAIMTIDTNPPAAEAGICLMGTDQGFGGPHDKLKSLTIQYGGKPILIPQEDLEAFYYVHLESFKVYQHEDSHFIYISTRSASGYYFCVWHIENGVYQKRYLYLLK